MAESLARRERSAEVMESKTPVKPWKTTMSTIGWLALCVPGMLYMPGSLDCEDSVNSVPEIFAITAKPMGETAGGGRSIFNLYSPAGPPSVKPPALSGNNLPERSLVLRRAFIRSNRRPPDLSSLPAETFLEPLGCSFREAPHPSVPSLDTAYSGANLRVIRRHGYCIVACVVLLRVSSVRHNRTGNLRAIATRRQRTVPRHNTT